MYSLTISITDYITPLLARLEDITLPGINKIAGRAAVNLTQEHLRERNATRANKLGGPRSNYYEKAAESVNYQDLGDSVLVQISALGIGMKFTGGEIKPVNAKALTIAACAEAYGKRAREFDNLRLVWPKGANRGWLEEAPSQDITIKPRRQRAKAKQGPPSYKLTPGAERGGKIMFWLVSKAVIPRDPDVIPDEREYSAAIEHHVGAYIARQIARERAAGRSSQ